KKQEGALFDLRSLRYFVNGGEQVHRSALEEFIAATAMHGFEPRAMQPAFGMAETCTGITYDNDFVLERSYKEVGGTDFIGLGTVIPGVEVRIADGEDRLLREGQIGRLQIRGSVVTPGYYADPSSNAAAVTADGWFNSGDLGFLLDRRLYITGREKEMIIVRGMNIYCHDVEALVGDLDGVEAGMVGVFPIQKADSGADGFGIGYVGDPSAETLREIRRAASQRLGIQPDVIVPLEKEQFPKTTSGKIQRSQLARQLAAGELDASLQRADLEEENEQTLPDWFHEAVWIPEPVHGLDGPLPPCHRIVISDRPRDLEDRPHPQVRQAIIPRAAAGQEIARLLRTWRLLPREVLVLIDDTSGATMDLEGTLAIARALAEPAYRDLALTWIGIHETVESSLFFARRALLRSFAQERGQTAIVLCDVDGRTPWRDVVAGEMNAGIDRSRDLRHRGGVRFVHRLQHVPLEASVLRRAAEAHEPALSLVPGGLGGIGRAVCELLLRRGGQRVIVTGRSEPALKPVVWRELTELAASTGGEIVYLEHDLIHDDPEELCRQVRDAEGRWGLPLSTVVQATAPEVREGPIDSFQTRDYERALQENDRITRALEALSEGRRGIHLVEIGSVNGSFGGFHVPVYAWRKGYELGRIEHFAGRGVLHTNIQQTMWSGVGMSAGRTNSGAGRGYHGIGRAQGMHSLSILLARRTAGLLYVGLDGRHREIHEQLTLRSRRRLLAPAQGIASIEDRLPAHLEATADLFEPWTPARLLAQRQVTLEDERGSIVDRYRKGWLTIRRGDAAAAFATSLPGHYDADGCILLGRAAERYSGHAFDGARIEAILRSHSAIRDCRLLHRWDESGREQWIACVAGNGGLTVVDVEEHARRHLPRHLRPHRVLVVDAIPYTRGGQLDGSALERMTQGPVASEERVAPRNELESRLAAVWAQVLGVDLARIGVHDSFFELGGNSLLATQLVSRIRGQLEFDLQVRDLFDANTVAGIAAVLSTIEERGRESAGEGTPDAEFEEVTL
ncbi:MAG TPA: SDR family NAD(P)-dependent oxidoreductase, partial [Thermoanaerobaculia bacterium]|nr:SDR family NAD(P)-dependent oxidoreductase [Thermoanaerobaculia bacterium]